MDAVVSVRTIRSEMNIPPGKGITAYVKPLQEEHSELIAQNKAYLQTLGKIEDLLISGEKPDPGQSASAVTSAFEIIVPLSGLIDIEKEKARLQKDLANSENEAQRCKEKLEYTICTYGIV